MGGAVSVPMLSLQGVVECFNAVVVYIIEISVFILFQDVYSRQSPGDVRCTTCGCFRAKLMFVFFLKYTCTAVLKNSKALKLNMGGNVFSL